MDTISPERRSQIMSRVRSRHTKPELAIRQLVYSLRYRYRLHARDLPGKPDLVFRKRWKVIFVHGCFWHRHPGCPLARLPKSRVEFWVGKLEKNRERDVKNLELLNSKGWSVLTIWECELQDLPSLTSKIERFLNV